MSEAQTETTPAVPTTLAEKLAAAREAAAASAVQHSVPALAGGGSTYQGTALTPHTVGGGVAMSIAGMAASTFSVDDYVKVSKDGHGIVVNGKLIADPIDVVIDLSECIAHQAIKGGDPVRYEKTYDGVNAKSGMRWADAIAGVQQLDPKARPYETVDVCFTPVEDVKVKNEVLIQAGSRIGYSLSTTNKSNFVNFIKALARQGVDPDNGKVFARIGCEARSGGGYTWGLMTFEFIAPYVEDSQE